MPTTAAPPIECRVCGGDGYTDEATSHPMREATTECRACQGTGREPEDRKASPHRRFYRPGPS